MMSAEQTLAIFEARGAVVRAAVEWHAAMLANKPDDVHGQAAWDRYEAAIGGLEKAVRDMLVVCQGMPR